MGVKGVTLASWGFYTEQLEAGMGWSGVSSGWGRRPTGVPSPVLGAVVGAEARPMHSAAWALKSS